MILPEESQALCKELLNCISKVCDLRFHTVQAAAKQLEIPTEQINLLLKGDISKVRINTILTIAHRAGKSVMVGMDQNPKESAQHE